jgi:polyisoprenoid-binding protein YceI
MIIAGVLLVGVAFAEAGFGQEEQKPKDTASAKLTPVPISGGVAVLSPENTKIDFVGTHVGDNPDPRLGGFQQFAGQIEMTDDGTSIKKISMAIEIGSVWTEFPKLTEHLKSADFFDVQEFPSATFESTKIEPDNKKPNMYRIFGNLSLMSNTKEVSIPAKVSIAAQGITIEADFTVHRTKFGMDKLISRVDKRVDVRIVVGQKTVGAVESQLAKLLELGGQVAGAPKENRDQPMEEQDEPSGGGGSGSGGSGRGGSPPTDSDDNVKEDDIAKNAAQVFMDAYDNNKDGKLTGDEIPESIRKHMDRLDANKDGEVSLEELEKGIIGG